MAARWLALDDDQERFLAPVTKALIEAADIRAEHLVLDIGCGTGGTTRAAARLAARVHGVDISPPMIDRALRTAASEGIGNIGFEVADAQTAALRPGNDRIISRFGTMFFADPVAAFSNIAKALRRDGRMDFICWGRLEDNPWFAVPRQVAADRLGPPGQVGGNAAGPMAFCDPVHVSGILADAGLGDIRAKGVDLVLSPGATVEDCMKYTSLGPIASLMREKGGSPSDLAAIKDNYRIALEEFATPAGVRIPARLILYSATP